MYRTLILHALLLVAVLMLCSRPSFAGDTSSVNLSGKKVLWGDSYHKGYGWSDGIEAGGRKGLVGSGVTLDLIRMDTKRADDAKSLQSAGLKVLEKVEAFHPDVIIASDDSAQKYAVVPHLLQKSIPIVFVGVNWDASIYGYPRNGVTGMVEVDPIATLVSYMRTLSKGTRFAIMASDNQQGEYGAKTALRILRGTAAETIPLVTNQKTRLALNHALGARCEAC